MFLEERITERAIYGSSFDEEYDVDVSQTVGGNAYRALRHPYPTLRYSINLLNLDETIVSSVLDLHHRSGGPFGGFRARHHQDYSTNNYTGVPTFNDQIALLDSEGVYQIIRWYGTQGDTTQTRRRIRKPYGTILVGIRDDYGNPVQLTQGFTTSDITGLITFAANKTGVVTSISQAANAVIGITSHPFVVGDSVHLSAVVGMIEINGLRGTVTAITADTITTDIDTSGFTAYASGGEVNTRPQPNEDVVAGCYFDIPVRFETNLSGVTHTSYKVLAVTAVIVELLNP
ncbi:MAG: DUF2460 domain-containing protein [Porticoccus sp.]|uniref:DUF2460 domain-containing protein n=1 Tax=Porticoccus sp. TaxID=2024853 RepID=UPI0032990EB9